MTRRCSLVLIACVALHDLIGRAEQHCLDLQQHHRWKSIECPQSDKALRAALSCDRRDLVARHLKFHAAM
jgi:hypothetical protein